ncbi:hypothetical protein LXL04_010977 [Taraxacum kok-saghyz]
MSGIRLQFVMAEIAAPYPQLSFLRFDKSAITPPNYAQRLHFSSRFLTSVPDVTGKRRRIIKIAVVRAKSGTVIEKEQEFKPSFEEYLKAMETVKSRREKRKVSTETPPSPSRSPSRKIDEGSFELKDSQDQITSRKVGNLEQGEVKKTWHRKKSDPKEPQLAANVKDINISPTIDEKHSKLQGQSFNTKRGSHINSVSSHDYARDTAVHDQSRVLLNSKQNEAMKKWTRKKLDSKESQVDTTTSFEKNEERYAKFQRQSFKGSETSYITTKSHMKKTSMVKYDSYDTIDTERAAFKSLEKFPDVCEQTRVSRVDMEDRIQKLAKCLNGASVDSPEWNFSKMMRSAKIRFADFSMIRLIQILGNYGNWRQVLQVIEWMQSRERFKSNRIRNIYTAALDALGKARRPVESLNVFHTMLEQMSSYPDIIAYRCIAVTLGQAGHMRELFHVIDTMRSPPKKKLSTGVLQKWDPRLEPDIIVYNAVLNACVRQKNLEGAFWVFQELKEHGQQPNSITYGLVMEVMLACEKYNLVHEFFKKMQKSFIPNSLTYKVLVNTLWKEGKVNEALLAVQEMEKRGIVGSAPLYYDLARCLCSEGRCDEAIVQIEKVCKVANKPLVVTYTGLIQACLDSKKIESGVKIFNHMCKFCSPNLVTYNIMIKGYLDHDKFEDAKKLFCELLENGDRVKSKGDYARVVLPDIHTFNLMLDACFVNKNWDNFEFIYIKMLQHGYFFNPKRHCSMVLEAYKAGKVNVLETTWEHVIAGDQNPPPSLVQEMFCMKLKEDDDYAAAFSCLISLPSSESHKYSRKSWVQCFREDPDLFREEMLLGIIDKLSSWSGTLYANGCYTSIFSFGDSLTDTGNIKQVVAMSGEVSMVLQPPYGETFFHQPTGRCSNGRLIIDFLAEILGLPLIPPFLHDNESEDVVELGQGVNYAVVGATTLAASFHEARGVHNLVTNASLEVQIGWFKESLSYLCSNVSDCRNLLGRSLILMGELGGNDYNHPVLAGKPIEEIKSYVPLVIDTIVSAVNELIDMGAQTLIIPGNVPHGCYTVFNEIAEYHNKLLQTKLNHLRVLHPTVIIIYADYYNAAMQFFRSPDKFGFTNGALKACCGSGGGPLNYNASVPCGSGSANVCDQPDTYANWDGLHYTEAANRLISKSLFQGPYTTPQFKSVCPTLTLEVGVGLWSSI